MPNRYLPLWEYIPDGEPRVFGDRVYIYGSHDRAGSDDFCDYVLKCWSAPVNDLNNWVCHGVTFRVKPDGDFPSDTDWTPDKNQILLAPDVVCRNGKKTICMHILSMRQAALRVSDRPEPTVLDITAFKIQVHYIR